MRNRFLAAAAAAAATAACAPGRRSPAEKTPMAVQEWKGQYGGPGEPGIVVAADQAAWERAWRQVGKDAPALDFTKFVGVMAFVGEEPTGGFTVLFDEPLVQGDDIVVHYRIHEPGGFAAQALARPWKARAYARPRGRVIVTKAQP